MKTAFHPQSD